VSRLGLAAAVLLLAACKERAPLVVSDAAAPAASAEPVDADGKLPWATEIDMDAQAHASASAPPPPPPPAPNAPPKAVAFDGPVGTFTGNVKDQGSMYTMTVSLTATGGTVSYGAPLNCKGRWTFQNQKDEVYRYVEKITDQPSPPTCMVDVNLQLSKASPTSYVYSATGGKSTALLKKL
jgi:hypothetical protein